MIVHPGRSHGCCPVRATESSLPSRRYLPASPMGIKEGVRNSYYSKFPKFLIRLWPVNPCFLNQMCGALHAKSVAVRATLRPVVNVNGTVFHSVVLRRQRTQLLNLDNNLSEFWVYHCTFCINNKLYRFYQEKKIAHYSTPRTRYERAVFKLTKVAF